MFSFSFSVFFQLFIRLCNVCVCVHVLIVCVACGCLPTPSRARRARAALPQTHSRLEVCNSGWLSRWNDGSLGILPSTSPPPGGGGGCFPLTAGYCVDSQNFTFNFPPLTQRLTHHLRRRPRARIFSAEGNTTCGSCSHSSPSDRQRVASPAV